MAGKTTEISESAHAHFTKPLTIASMIALQVVRTSFGFHFRSRGIHGHAYIHKAKFW